MIAQGFANALRETAQMMVACADQLDVLGKFWLVDTAPAPPAVRTAKKRAAIRKDLRSTRRKRSHWTQTPEGKAKIALMNKKRWAKKEGNDQAASSSTPS